MAHEKREEWLDSITTHIQSQGLSATNAEISHIELAIKVSDNFIQLRIAERINVFGYCYCAFQDSCSAGLDDNETVFSIINAFDVPKFKYSIEQKKYAIDKTKRNLLPTAEIRADFSIDRYTMLWQRTNRHELFSPAITGAANVGKKFQLSKVENLLSMSSVKDVVVLGMLAQLTENKFYIEDPTGCVPLDLNIAQYHSGFFCEGSFVLVEGTYTDGTLVVSGLGFPPPEAANSSRAYFGSLNTWGGKSSTLLKSSSRLLEIERTNTDATIVFLADCWLDDRTVLEKLKILLIGYNESPPVAIVLMGPFLRNSTNPYALKDKLQALGAIISNECVMLKNETDIILVPAIDDPVAPVIMPRPPLPYSLCANFCELVPRTVLATNPCRLQYCTQQIVVCRADLVTKLCRNTIHFPEDGQLEDHVRIGSEI